MSAHTTVRLSTLSSFDFSVDWDSLLKQGGDLHGILDQEKIARDNDTSVMTPPHSGFVYRYSSSTRIHKPDGVSIRIL